MRTLFLAVVILISFGAIHGQGVSRSAGRFGKRLRDSAKPTAAPRGKTRIPHLFPYFHKVD